MVTSLLLNPNFIVGDSLTLTPESLAVLDRAFSLLQERLQAFASNSEFNQKMGLAFGDRFSFDTVESLRQQWLTEDFKTLPTIEILSPTELQGAQGAFSAQTNRIYLSANLLRSNLENPQIVSQVLLEEIGHFVDAQINSVDAPGDEGAIFSALVGNGFIDEQQLQSLKLEDDRATLILNNQTVPVELADTYQGTNLGTIVGGLQTVLTNLNTSLKTVALANKLPLVGTALKDVSDPALDFLNQLKNQLATLNTSSVTQVQQNLFNILGSGGLNWLGDRNSNGIVDLNDITVSDTADRVTFNFTLSKNPTSITGGIGFDLGLPGLGLTVSDNSKVKTDIGFTFDLAFGVNKDTGFFFDTSPTNELKVNLNTTLPGFNATGELGFLEVGVKDNLSNPTNFAGTFGLDLQNGFTVAPTFNGQANINLSLLGKIPTTGDTSIPLLPSIGTDLSLQWGFNNANASNPLSSTFGNVPQLAFKNVSVNIGSFLSQFISPILGTVQDVFSPIKPVIDFLNLDLPLLDISIVDLLAVAQSVSGKNTTGLEMIKYLDTILNIPTAPNVAVKLGDFNLGSSKDVRVEVLKDLNIANSFTSILNDVDQALRAIGATNTANYLKDSSNGLSNKGPTFPLLQSPQEALKLLLGQDADLFRWDLSDILRINAQGGGFYGAIIGAKVDYEFSAGMNLILGYDTYGLRRFSDNNFTTPTLLGDGFYLVDTPGPEAYVNANFQAGVGVGIEGANLSVGGGIDGSVNLNVNDPNQDGKLRFSEVDDCFIEASGQIDASLEAKLVLGWGIFKIEKSFPIEKGTLLSFAAGCHSEDPIRNVLAKAEAGNLVLLMGPRAGERVVNSSTVGSQQDVAESFVLKPTAGQPGRVDVFAFGAIVSYAPGDRIIGNGGQEGDVIFIDAAIVTPANLQGDTGADQLTGGSGNDILDGGSFQDTLWGGVGNDTLFAGDDDDWLDGGVGADNLDGGNGFDVVNYVTSDTAILVTSGSNGSLVGSSGTANGDILINVEQITGSNFNDTLSGNSDNNVFAGGTGDDSLSGNDGNDFLVGGVGADNLNGDNGSDAVSYIDSTAAVKIDLSIETASGGEATGDVLLSIENAEGSQLSDTLIGNDVANSLIGRGGNDQIFGNAGDDTLDGGTGDDYFSETAAANAIDGDDGYDRLDLLVDTPIDLSVNYSDASNGILSTGGTVVDIEDFRLEGNSGKDFADLSATSHAEFRGKSGNDTFIGGSGDDYAEGNEDDDNLSGLEGADTIFGQAGNDTILGDTENDLLDGGLGQNSLDGGDGDDFLIALDLGSVDTLDGGTGTNRLSADYSDRTVDIIFIRPIRKRT
jgi:Ca2+-binding RTX toxin-like protein